MKFSIRPYTIAMTASLTLLTGHMIGCGGEEEEPVVVAPTPVQRGPQYAVQDLPMNVKVQFPEKYTPESEALGQAIADFASSIASGDASAFSSMLSEDSRFLMQDVIMKKGEWEESTKDIKAVRIVNLEDGESVAKVALAIGTEDSAYLTAWSLQRVDGSTWEFSAMGVAPRTTSRVALLDDTPFTEDALFLDPVKAASEADDDEAIEDGEQPDDAGDDFSTPSSPGSPSRPSSPSSPGAPASPFG